MSVIKNKRSLSDLEFFHNAIKLRTTMTDLLLRDFGVKAKNKNAQVYPKKFKMDKEDGERFMELCEKYQITSIIESYPDWLINEMRTSILENLRQLLANITSANSIYPVCIDEWTERRLRQDRAIGNCGIFGGKRAAVMEFLEKFVPLLKKTVSDVEMVIHNYVMYRYFENRCKSITTRMTLGETDLTKWWRHK